MEPEVSLTKELHCLSEKIRQLEKKLEKIQKIQTILQDAFTRIYEDQRRRERIL